MITLDYCSAGLLSAVGLLSITASDTTLSLTWEPPFTLDVTSIRPDITGYCVDVINSTSSVTLHSQCGITETLFTYPIPENTNCTVVEFIVTPVNIIGQGQSAAKSYIRVRSSRSHQCITVMRYIILNLIAIQGPQVLSLKNNFPGDSLAEISDRDVFIYLLNMVRNKTILLLILRCIIIGINQGSMGAGACLPHPNVVHTCTTSIIGVGRCLDLGWATFF